MATRLLALAVILAACALVNAEPAGAKVIHRAQGLVQPFEVSKPTTEQLLEVSSTKQFVTLVGKHSLTDGHSHLFSFLQEDPATVTNEHDADVQEQAAMNSDYVHKQGLLTQVEQDIVSLGEPSKDDGDKHALLHDLKTAIQRCKSLESEVIHGCHDMMCKYHDQCGSDRAVEQCKAEKAAAEAAKNQKTVAKAEAHKQEAKQWSSWFDQDAKHLRRRLLSDDLYEQQVKDYDNMLIEEQHPLSSSQQIEKLKKQHDDSVQANEEAAQHEEEEEEKEHSPECVKASDDAYHRCDILTTDSFHACAGELTAAKEKYDAYEAAQKLAISATTETETTQPATQHAVSTKASGVHQEKTSGTHQEKTSGTHQEKSADTTDEREDEHAEAGVAAAKAQLKEVGAEVPTKPGENPADPQVAGDEVAKFESSRTAANELHKEAEERKKGDFKGAHEDAKKAEAAAQKEVDEEEVYAKDDLKHANDATPQAQERAAVVDVDEDQDQLSLYEQQADLYAKVLEEDSDGMSLYEQQVADFERMI